MSYLHDLIRNPPADRGACWLWPLKLRADGRPKVGFGLDDAVKYGRLDDYAYRVTYTELRGPIPEGLTLDHLCEKPACVNPWHLEPVSQAENTRRARKRGSFRRLPSGRWQVRYSSEDGKRTAAPATFETLDAAEAWAGRRG